MTAQDPYESFRFRIRCDGDYVAGVSRAGGLTGTDAAVEHREGRDPAAIGRPADDTPSITLQRGITFDAGFQSWATKGPGLGSNLENRRRDLILDVFDEAGRRAASYHVTRAWVSEYQALPDLDGRANAVAIEHIRVEHEGIERDDVS